LRVNFTKIGLKYNSFAFLKNKKINVSTSTSTSTSTLVSQLGKYKRKSQIPADTELVFNSGTIERHRSSMVKLPLPPRPTYSNKFLMDSASPILFFPLDYYFFLSISKSNEMQTTSREKEVV
jgi:hypothetical protein